MEIWRDIYYTDSITGEIIDYRGHYQVSNLGRCRNINYWGKTKLMKLNDSNGYKRVHFRCRKENTDIKLLIHRIVSHLFLPNQNNYPIINHKDENPSNNVVWINDDGSIDYEKTNLEWCDYSYNITYNGNRDKVAEKLSIPVIQLDMDGNFIKQWSSAKEAARNLDLFSTSITRCCKGKLNQTGNFKWRYAS